MITKQTFWAQSAPVKLSEESIIDMRQWVAEEFGCPAEDLCMSNLEVVRYVKVHHEGGIDGFLSSI